jgi:hypothetical protein
MNESWEDELFVAIKFLQKEKRKAKKAIKKKK